jgi:Heterokaryon incompatibility protein (HET)
MDQMAAIIKSNKRKRSKLDSSRGLIPQNNHKSKRLRSKKRKLGSGDRFIPRLDVDSTSSSSPKPSAPKSEETADIEPKYEYDPFPKTAGIRLLILHGGNKAANIECSLVFRKNEEYEALSYVWSQESSSNDLTSPPMIKIRTESGTARFVVSSNLLAALKELRHEHKRRRFWVDAICINQNDPAEKSAQVPLMAEIYSAATNVIVWLGEDTHESPIALALMQKIRYLKNFDQFVEKHTTCEEWEALTDLMRRPWFSRRWVVQEIALAKEATLHCGAYKIKWSEFADAVALFEEMAGRVRRKFKESVAHNHHSDYLGDVKALSASRLVNVTTNLVRRSDDGLVLKRLFSLESLVSTLTPFEATVPHDIIYAVLSLAKDTSGSVVDPVHGDTLVSPTTIAATIPTVTGRTPEVTSVLKRVVFGLKVHKYPVNYDKSFYEVCRDFLEFTTKKSHSIDILCRPWAPEGYPNLPSWIKTVHYTPYGPRLDNFLSRKHADTLVGLPKQGLRTYSASREYPGEWSFSKNAAIPSLSIRGFILDTVARTEDSARSGVIPDSWMKFGGWLSGEKSQRECFWRTMVADRGPRGENPPTYYELACTNLLQERVRDDDINTGQIIERINSSILIEFTERLQSVIWGRKLIKTKTHGFIGLGPSKPKGVKKGDFVCILCGCSVPVLLRQVKDAPYFIFIGECYIHGMMDGEAFGIKNTENIDYEMFEIR